MKRWFVHFLISILLFPILGLITGGVIAYITPTLYESSATIQIRPISHTLSPQLVDHDRAAANERQLMLSDVILTEAIEAQNLKDEWATPEDLAIKRLRKALTIKQIRGTDLVDIRCRMDDPERANTVLDAVVSAYRDDRASAIGSRVDKSLDELRSAIAAQEKALESARQRMTRAIESNNDLLHRSQDKTWQQQFQFDEAKAEFETHQRLLEQLKIKLIGEEMQKRITENPVIVHQAPIVGRTPVAPKVPLYLIVGLAGGVVAGLGLPLLALPFYIRRKGARK